MGAVEENDHSKFAFYLMPKAEDAMDGQPRGMFEIRTAFIYAGIQPGSHVVHDGWAATVNLPWEEMQMRVTSPPAPNLFLGRN